MLSLSVEPLPSSVTVVAMKTVCAGPAFATGATSLLFILTIDGVLPSVASLTTSCTEYAPTRSATKVGWMEVGLVSTATLPEGIVTNDQLNVIGFPARSLDPLPFSVTTVPTGTVWSGPAFATGGECRTRPNCAGWHSGHAEWQRVQRSCWESDYVQLVVCHYSLGQRCCAHQSDFHPSDFRRRPRRRVLRATGRQ